MQTRCPHCQTIFRVTETQLNAAQGKVRCGKCQQVFNAEEHVSQPVDIEKIPPVVAKKSPAPIPVPTPAPPQIDWLQHEDKDDFDHIDLGHHADETNHQADIEVTESTPTFSKEQLKTTSFETDVNEHEFISIEVPEDVGTNLPEDSVEDTAAESIEYDVPSSLEMSEDENTDDDSSDDLLTLETIDDVDNTQHLANKTPLVPGGLNESFLGIEEDMTLPGIGPAYEDDTQLNYRDEQGLDDLQSEVKRQLQSTAEEDDVEEDAFDSVLGYIEDIEDVKKQSAKTSTVEYVENVESIELNAIPEPEDSNAVNWNDDTHHDPEVPASLRSSMQALQKKKRLPLLSAFMAIILFVLIADLGLQAIVFRSHDIATQWPQTRSLLTSVCHYLPCVYSGRREPRKIQLINRDVRVHPTAKHALLISATVENQSKHAQPYPRLAIKLSDLSGDVIAEREFAPKEYLKASESRLKLLRPNVPTLINLEVLDPGSEAVNFEFRFL